MKLLEVTRPSDKAEERAKAEAKRQAMVKRAVAAYVRALKAPQYLPHSRDVEVWLFKQGHDDPEAQEHLKTWIHAIGSLIGVDPHGDEEHFRAFSHHLGIPHEICDFVCNGGKLELTEAKKSIDELKTLGKSLQSYLDDSGKITAAQNPWKAIK